MVSRVGSTSTVPAGTASFAASLPAHAAGDRLLVVVGWKYDTAAVPTISAGWTLVASGTGGTGSTGNDVGPVGWAVYGRDAVSSGTSAPTITAGSPGPNTWLSWAFAYRPGSGLAWRDPLASSLVVAGSDTNAASPLSVTATSAWSGQPKAGDAILAVGVEPNDTAAALSGATITAAGLSGGTVSTASSQFAKTSLANDALMMWSDWTGFTGTATAAPVGTLTPDNPGNHYGAMAFVALRESAAPLSGTVAAVSGVSGEITVDHALSGTVAVVSGSSGRFQEPIPLDGEVIVVSDSVGDFADDAFVPPLFSGGIAFESSNTVTYPTPPADPAAITFGRAAVSVPEE